MRSRRKTSFLTLVVMLLSASGSISSGGEIPFYRQVAEFHAPLILQETGRNPKADAITRFDFDGDWKANNNWDNLDKFATPAYVYYDVIESKNHYFITYGFFHPRDYAYWLCILGLCHENDLEGVYVAVEKNQQSLFGKVIMISTIAHSSILSTQDPKPYPGTSQAVAVMIEWGGHATRYWEGNIDKSNTYLTYTYQHKADDPRGAKTGNFGYDLLPISEFWDRRNDVGPGRLFTTTYKYGGSRFDIGDVPYGFAGEKKSAGKAHAPWAWTDSDDKTIKRGDWFFDPAYAHSERLKKPAGFSLDYIYNPYLP